MNDTLFQAVTRALEGLPMPRLTVRKGRTGRRTNDPDGPYVRCDRELRTEELERVINTPVRELNVRVGIGEANGTGIGGIGTLAVQAAPEQARELHRGLHGKSINELAARMLGLNDESAWIEDQVLNGPNWAGDHAQWLTPAEMQEALQRLRTTTKATPSRFDCWTHVSRGRLQTLEQTFQPTKATKKHWIASARSERKKQEIAALIETEYPATTIAGDARIEATAIVGSGTTIAAEANLEHHTEVRKGCRIGIRATVRGGARIGAATVLEQDASIGAQTRVGAGCTVRARTTVGTNAEIGNLTVIGTASVIGDGVRLGKRCQVAEEAQIIETVAGDTVVIGHHASVGPRTRIGRQSSIGPAASVSDCVIPEQSITAGRLTISAQWEADRYAVHYRTDDADDTTVAPAAPEYDEGGEKAEPSATETTS